jgi:DNA polymerase V
LGRRTSFVAHVAFQREDEACFPVSLAELRKLSYFVPVVCYTPVQLFPRHFPLFSAQISAGFPSPADDHLEGELDLNDLLIQNGPATFFVRARGDSMDGDKRTTIQDGDLLIVDKSKKPKTGDIVIACLDGAFTVKRLRCSVDGIWLLPENKNYPEIRIEDGQEFCIWGVVTARVSQFR